MNEMMVGKPIKTCCLPRFCWDVRFGPLKQEICTSIAVGVTVYSRYNFCQLISL